MLELKVAKFSLKLAQKVTTGFYVKNDPFQNISESLQIFGLLLC